MSEGSVKSREGVSPAGAFGGGMCSIKARIVLVRRVFAELVGILVGKKTARRRALKVVERDVSEVVPLGHFSTGARGLLRF